MTNYEKLVNLLTNKEYDGIAVFLCDFPARGEVKVSPESFENYAAEIMLHCEFESGVTYYNNVLGSIVITPSPIAPGFNVGLDSESIEDINSGIISDYENNIMLNCHRYNSDTLTSEEIYELAEKEAADNGELINPRVFREDTLANIYEFLNAEYSA